MNENVMNQAEDFDLEDLMEDVAEDVAEDAEETEAAATTDYDLNILTDDLAGGASESPNAKSEESYEKNSNFNNSSDYLRKFSESFSTSFVLSPSFSGVNVSEYSQMKKQQDEKAEKLIKELDQNRPKPALLKKLAGK